MFVHVSSSSLAAASLALLLGGRLASAATCNADNCYRQLAGGSASAFCATYTTATSTATTGFPAYVSPSCGPVRVSSACSCLYPPPTATACPPLVTTTTTVTSFKYVTFTESASPAVITATSPGVLRGGDFGLDPWYNGDIINESSYGYRQPTVVGGGSGPNSWAASFSFDFDGIYELDQNVVLPNRATAYTLAFGARNAGGGGACAIIAGFGSRTSGAQFFQRQFPLTATFTQFSIRGTTDGTTNGYVALIVQCFSGENNTVILDAVSLGV